MRRDETPALRRSEQFEARPTHAVQAREAPRSARSSRPRFACVAVGSPPPGARARARARLREARFFRLRAVAFLISRGGRSSDSPTRALRRSALSAGACESLEDRLLIRLDFLPSRRALGPRCAKPPRARHRVARGASRFAARSFRGVFPALRARFESRVEAGRDGEHHARDGRSSRTPRWTSRRDFCAHLLIPLNECRKANYFSRGGASTTATCTRSASTKSASRARATKAFDSPIPPPTAPPMWRSENLAPRSIDHRSPPCPRRRLRRRERSPERASDPAPSPRPPAQVHDARRAAEGRPAPKTDAREGALDESGASVIADAGGSRRESDGREKKKNTWIEPFTELPRLGDRRARLSSSRPFAPPPLPPPRLGVVVIGARAAGRPSPLRYGSRASRRRREMKFLSRPGGGGYASILLELGAFLVVALSASPPRPLLVPLRPGHGRGLVRERRDPRGFQRVVEWRVDAGARVVESVRASSLGVEDERAALLEPLLGLGRDPGLPPPQDVQQVLRAVFAPPPRQGLGRGFARSSRGIC